ncbi:hypothetical protein SAMN02745215_00982 [Desulfitobacterium chlororespirans DSM 11544]|uniref:Uncharacterized protein n=1 Tax=Desulfitobacterium chlororespirans DSM 11544 TaxID=1121395 RepID=A0A1M7SK35_9FIRM|nr:hypothetical protein SAMN02745215_00982 [Desulfitobacterium chlororespirans DSM 11544]
MLCSKDWLKSIRRNKYCPKMKWIYLFLSKNTVICTPTVKTALACAVLHSTFQTQRVSQSTKTQGNLAPIWNKISAVVSTIFHFMRQLHELLWYLTEALTLQPADPIHSTLNSMLDETEQVTCLRPDLLMQLDLAAHRTKVNTLLLRTSELVRSEVSHGLKTQRGRKKTFGRGADLSKSIFLTQAQLNVAKGDVSSQDVSRNQKDIEFLRGE